MSIRAFIVIAVAILAIAGTPSKAQSVGNMCGFIGGAIGNPWAGTGSNGWATIFHATVEYVAGNNKTNSKATKSWGTFWQLTSILNGTYTTFSAYSNPSTGIQYTPSSSIANLAAIGVDFASNAIYNSAKASFPLDGNGITFELANALELPGQSPFYSSEEINVWYTSGFLRAANTGVIDQTRTLFISDLPGADLVAPAGKYAASLPIPDLDSCKAAFAAVDLVVPTPVPTVNQPALMSYKTLTYSISDQKTYQVNASILVQVISGHQLDSLGVSYVRGQVINGTRSYGFGTPSNYFSTSVTVDPISVPSCLTGLQFLYANSTQFPYLDANGLTFSLAFQLGTTIPGAPFDGQADGPGITNATSWQVSTFYSTGVVEENNVFNLAFPALPQTITLA